MMPPISITTQSMLTAARRRLTEMVSAIVVLGFRSRAPCSEWLGHEALIP
jgi:hypothetical protein